jgi:hypothetical protein
MKDSKTILSYNKTLKEPLDLKWRYKYVDITCSHFGEHKSRSEGHRPNQKVYANECPFRVRVVFKPAAEKFIVMKCETRHGPLPPKVPHPISAEHYYSSILIFTIAAMRMLWLIILSIELIG